MLLVCLLVSWYGCVFVVCFSTTSSENYLVFRPVFVAPRTSIWEPFGLPNPTFYTTKHNSFLTVQKHRSPMLCCIKNHDFGTFTDAMLNHDFGTRTAPGTPVSKCGMDLGWFLYAFWEPKVVQNLRKSDKKSDCFWGVWGLTNHDFWCSPVWVNDVFAWWENYYCFCVNEHIVF